MIRAQKKNKSAQDLVLRLLRALHIRTRARARARTRARTRAHAHAHAHARTHARTHGVRTNEPVPPHKHARAPGTAPWACRLRRVRRQPGRRYIASRGMRVRVHCSSSARSSTLPSHLSPPRPEARRQRGRYAMALCGGALRWHCAGTSFVVGGAVEAIARSTYGARAEPAALLPCCPAAPLPRCHAALLPYVRSEG